jgi:hypothetical protein
VKRALLWAVFTALFACAVPGVAAADTCPVYDGAMSFGTIEGIEDPEDYCFEVSLGEGQDLRQIDDSHAAVFYSSGHRAFDIQAVEAHDAVGARVPTSLAVTGTNVITLTSTTAPGTHSPMAPPSTIRWLPGRDGKAAFRPSRSRVRPTKPNCSRSPCPAAKPQRPNATFPLCGVGP